MRSFLIEPTKKNIFWISNMDSRAHSWPCRPVPARFQLTTTYWHKSQSFEHVLTIDLDRSVPISSTIRVACSLCNLALILVLHMEVKLSISQVSCHWKHDQDYIYFISTWMSLLVLIFALSNRTNLCSLRNMEKSRLLLFRDFLWRNFQNDLNFHFSPLSEEKRSFDIDQKYKHYQR